MKLTEQEQSLIDRTVNIANDFVLLPVLCPDDQKDVYFHIRAIQNIIFSRPVTADQSAHEEND